MFKILLVNKTRRGETLDTELPQVHTNRDDTCTPDALRSTVQDTTPYDSRTRNGVGPVRCDRKLGYNRTPSPTGNGRGLEFGTGQVPPL